MNKAKYILWKKGVEDAMRIVGEHIRCPMVEEKVRNEIEIQRILAERQEKEDLNISAEFDKFFDEFIAGVDTAKSAVKDVIDNTDFGWEEPVKRVEKGIKNWQSRFREHFKDGPVNRKPRK